ncbi:GPN-loop GTPase QQT1 [Linum perenne]
MVFGQVVIGPPGSGKTTYCNGLSQFLPLIGRKVAVINLDPANDSLSYDCAVNIEDLIKLSDVMAEHSPDLLFIRVGGGGEAAGRRL